MGGSFACGTFQYLPHPGTQMPWSHPHHLHSSYGEASWNDRHGRIPAIRNPEAEDRFPPNCAVGMATSTAVCHCLAPLRFPISNDPQETRSRLALQHCARKCAFRAILLSQQDIGGKPSPALAKRVVLAVSRGQPHRRSPTRCLSRRSARLRKAPVTWWRDSPPSVPRTGRHTRRAWCGRNTCHRWRAGFSTRCWPTR